ncbi:MAG TPA: putative capsular polysaccharide synthesis family protein [Candidatus Limnocylindria bacterium]|nr:putative capsular polysaccharide synthesis family protein [Candidatus Limnocylindria bacterium]
MGKVASSTLEATLQGIPSIEVFRAHVLNHHGQKRPAQMDRRLLESWLVFEHLIQSGIPTKVVTLVREPIGRNISAYFQNLDQLWGLPQAHQRLTMPQLIAGFFEKFDHQRTLRWFDDEFKPVLGLEVYEHPFDPAAGFQRLVHAPYDVLILRVDVSDTVKARQLAELIGQPEISLVQKNIGETKGYSALYKEFLGAVPLPKSYVDEMLDHRYTRHFFSAVEIEQLRRKWLRAP